MTASGGQYKLIFGEGMTLTVNSGGLWLIFHINSANVFVIPEKMNAHYGQRIFIPLSLIWIVMWYISVVFLVMNTVNPL